MSATLPVPLAFLSSATQFRYIPQPSIIIPAVLSLEDFLKKKKHLENRCPLNWVLHNAHYYEVMALE